MENKGIALKRHHKNRLKNKRKRDMVYHDDMPINKHVNTPTMCSGECCGNPRNHYGNSKKSKTMQELRVDESFNFDLDRMEFMLDTEFTEIPKFETDEELVEWLENNS